VVFFVSTSIRPDRTLTIAPVPYMAHAFSADTCIPSHAPRRDSVDTDTKSSKDEKNCDREDRTRGSSRARRRRHTGPRAPSVLTRRDSLTASLADDRHHHGHNQPAPALLMPRLGGSDAPHTMDPAQGNAAPRGERASDDTGVDLCGGPSSMAALNWSPDTGSARRPSMKFGSGTTSLTRIPECRR